MEKVSLHASTRHFEETFEIFYVRVFLARLYFFSTWSLKKVWSFCILYLDPDGFITSDHQHSTQHPLPGEGLQKNAEGGFKTGVCITFLAADACKKMWETPEKE